MSLDCVLTGRMTGDMTDRVSENGKVLHCFTVASNRGWGDSRQTDFVDCMAFAPVLDKQKDVMLKGSMVKVVGHMQSRTKEDGQTGKKQTYWNLIVSSAEVLFQKKKETTAPAVAPDDFTADFEPDIPF